MKKKLVSILLTMLMVFCAAPFVAFAESCDGGASCTHEAAIGNEHYATLADAVTAASDNATITLLKDVATTSNINITKAVTLNLNGKTITANSVNAKQKAAPAFTIKEGGKLDVTGTGTIEIKQEYAAFYVKGNATDDSSKPVSLVVGKDVTVEGGAFTVFVERYDKNNNCSYNVKVDIYGTLIGYETIYVSGMLKATSGNVPEITLHSGAKIEDSTGLYLAGYAKTTIEDNVSIKVVEDEDAENTISIAAGELTINGGEFTTANSIGSTQGVGGAIDETKCCALSIKQHSTNLPLKVTVNGGTFEAAIPYNQQTGQSATPAPDKVQLSITGGTFTSTSSASGAEAVKSADKTGFITGGTYTDDVTKYCAEGYIATENKDGKYVVGLIPDEVVDADLDTDIKQGEPDVKVDENITDKESAKTVAKSVSADLKDTKAAENITVSDADKKNAVQKLVAAGQITVKENGDIVPASGSGNVTITIIEEPYLEVEVTELKTDSTTGKKELALDITPKYNLKATTDTKDPDKTVTVSTGNTLTVNEKTKVTIELPSGFANSGDKLLVTHTKRNGSIEYLTGSVTAENSKLNLSFTTSSFSLFAVSNEYSASIGEGDDMQVYGTLQSAVDAVKNGETIKLYKDGEKAVVKRTVSFKVDPSYTDKESGETKSYNYTITLGDNCTRKDTGNENEWNITYTAPVSKKSPNTGDNSELGIFAVAGLISAVGVALVLRRKHSM